MKTEPKYVVVNKTDEDRTFLLMIREDDLFLNHPVFSQDYTRVCSVESFTKGWCGRHPNGHAYKLVTDTNGKQYQMFADSSLLPV